MQHSDRVLVRSSVPFTRRTRCVHDVRQFQNNPIIGVKNLALKPALKPRRIHDRPSQPAIQTFPQADSRAAALRGLSRRWRGRDLHPDTLELVEEFPNARGFLRSPRPLNVASDGLKTFGEEGQPLGQDHVLKGRPPRRRVDM